MSKKLDYNSKHAEKYATLGLNISYYRRKMNMTQEQLGFLCGLSRTYISNIESPTAIYAISMDSFFNIAEVLQVTPSDLLKEK